MKNVANNIVETLQTLESVNPETLVIVEEPAILGYEKGHHEYMGMQIMREEGEWNVYQGEKQLFSATDLDEAAILIQAMVNPTHISLEAGRPVGPLKNETKSKEDYLANHDEKTAILRKIEYYDAKVQVVAHNGGDAKTFVCVVVKAGHGLLVGDQIELSDGRVFAGMYKNYLWRRDYRTGLHTRRAKLMIQAG